MGRSPKRQMMSTWMCWFLPMRCCHAASVAGLPSNDASEASFYSMLPEGLYVAYNDTQPERRRLLILWSSFKCEENPIQYLQGDVRLRSYYRSIIRAVLSTAGLFEACA